MRDKFENIIVVGMGRVANECCKIAAGFFDFAAIRVGFKNEVGLDILLAKDERDAYFNSLKNSLIISANNFYIFKQECIKNNLIINYHNSLLPKHKGVNAHVWAIFDADDTAGISWHVVDEGIDTGGIITQASLKISDNMSSAKLLLAQHALAISSFKDTLCTLKNHGYKADKFKKVVGGEYHFLYDLPSNGLLDISRDFDYIARTLLAFDVGAFRASLPRLCVDILNERRQVEFYELSDDCIKLSLSGKVELVLRRDK